jgi:hypothetical protein
LVGRAKLALAVALAVVGGAAPSDGALDGFEADADLRRRTRLGHGLAATLRGADVGGAWLALAISLATSGDCAAAPPFAALDAQTVFARIASGADAERDAALALCAPPPPPAGDAAGDAAFALSDRVASALRHLDDGALASFIASASRECVAGGRLEGLLLTGLSPRGARLLQAYLDRTCDLMTAAVCGVWIVRAAQLELVRLSLHAAAAAGAVAAGAAAVQPLEALVPAPLTAAVRAASRWVRSYREVLNRLRLWPERAEFDVMRAQLLGAESGGILAGLAQAALAALERGGGAGPPAADAPAPASATASYAPARSLFPRCAQCKTSLELPSLVEGSATAVDWLSRQRPRMPSCPACRATLPRCELCLLPLSSINPVLQLSHLLRGEEAGRGEAAPGGRLRDSLPLSEHWAWCLSCTHGGHLEHLREWFATHSVCAAGGCMCQCALLR